MRIKFVEDKSRYLSAKECPWAERVAKVFGGYMCFESNDDYKLWKNNK